MERNLPVPRTSLIGREHDVAQVRQLLVQGPERLVTLTGIGGCGKTRLALQVALDLRDSFPDGVWHVELAPLTDPFLVPEMLATALGVRNGQSRVSFETLVAFLQARELVLVLDNCEHLSEACADLADRLLSACPRLRILTTSREPLQIAGERRYRVLPLPVPDLDQPVSPDDLARCPAVQLFVERAVAVEPHFRLTPENAGAVARICTLLGGIPLALELAAARVRVLSPAQIVERLDDCFRLLTGNNRLAPTRQQTLKATLDWSYNLLPEVEQAAFRRLAVFAGGWSVEGAEAVCGESGPEAAEVLDLLSRLVDKSLVLAGEQQGETRFRLLEPIRQYAEQRLRESGETDATQSRLAAFCLALAERIEPELAGPEQVAWLARLDRDHDNMRAALQWALHSDKWEVLLRLCCALWSFWDTRGYLGEGRQWLDHALAHAGEAPASRQANASLGAGTLAHLQCDYAAGSRYLEQSLSLYRDLGDKVGVLRALNGLGLIAEEQGDYDGASVPLAESLALARDLGHKASIQAALNRLGNVEVGRRDYGRARTLFEESLALSRDLRDKRKQAVTLANVGGVARLQGDLTQAAAFAGEAISLFHDLGDRRSLTVALGIAAMVVTAKRQAQCAVRLFGAAETLANAIRAPLTPVNRALFAPDLAGARSQLGDTAFATAWAEGCALGLEQVVACALDGLAGEPETPPTTARVRPFGLSDALTSREREVARLVAQGYTDRQIAAELTITEGTAGLHVHHILEKLGLRSRVQVVGWTLAQETDQERPN